MVSSTAQPKQTEVRKMRMRKGMGGCLLRAAGLASALGAMARWWHSRVAFANPGSAGVPVSQLPSRPHSCSSPSVLTSPPSSQPSLEAHEPT